MINNTTHRLLRVGLAFAFIYPAVSAWFSPYIWLGYFPGFILDAVGSNSNELILLHTFGAVEIVIGLWFLYGKKLMIPSAIATLILALIVIVDFRLMDVVFRDISIALMSSALFLDAWKNNTQPVVELE